MKTIDTNAYVSVLKELVQDDKEVSLRVAGTSMEPFLVDGRDHICFQKPEGELQPGDMAFYQRTNGQYIMHRVWNVAPEGYYFVGDRQVVIEGPLAPEQIFAVVTKVKRNGRWIGPDNLTWKFYARVWPKTRGLRALWGRAIRKADRMVKGQDE